MGSKIITDVDFAHDLTDMSFVDDTTLISEDKANEFLPRQRGDTQKRQDQSYNIEYGGSIYDLATSKVDLGKP